MYAECVYRMCFLPASNAAGRARMGGCGRGSDGKLLGGQARLSAGCSSRRLVPEDAVRKYSARYPSFVPSATRRFGSLLQARIRCRFPRPTGMTRAGVELAVPPSGLNLRFIGKQDCANPNARRETEAMCHRVQSRIRRSPAPVPAGEARGSSWGGCTPPGPRR